MRSLFGPAQATSPITKQRARLQVEVLEDRVVPAQTFTVTTFLDNNVAHPGFVSLRDAINSANSNGNAGAVDTIRFDSSKLTGKTIQLDSSLGEIPIQQSVSINGLGATLLKVSGPVGGEGAGSRIFNISGGEGALVVTVQGLTLTNGRPSGDGGAIYAHNGSAGDSLTLKNDVLTNNIAGGEGGEGGAVKSTSGALLIQSCTFSGNQTGGEGGAIEVEGNRLTIQDSTFANNLAGVEGGAVMIETNGPVLIERTTFADNHATDQGGGAVWFNHNASGTATISQSSFYGNVCGNEGGAIGTETESAGTVVNLTIQNTTISSNTAQNKDGGGIFWGKGTLNLRNVTISQNKATHGEGGGVYATSSRATTIVNVVNSIIEDKSDHSGRNDITAGSLSGGTVTYNVQYSLIQSVPPGTINGLNSHNIFNVSANLAPLGYYYGGKTKSQPPKLGSPAIQAGLKSLVPDLLVDQNGNVRFHGTTVDLGAVETGLGRTRRGA
ncbi:MAG: hypothetical protein HYR84_00360 [Planctomycetes bacterium]|nr:hypothetical protein [Planctomycetota bacterium]